MTALAWRLLLLASVGCAGRVPVAIDVEAVSPAPDAGEVVPQFVELQHADQGWIHVDFDGSEQVARRLAQGVDVPFATTDLPRGRYESIRFGYLTMTPVLFDDRRETTESSTRPARWVPTETLVLRPFCIGSSDPQIVLQVSRSAPGELGSTRVTVEAPPCE